MASALDDLRESCRRIQLPAIKKRTSKRPSIAFRSAHRCTATLLVTAKKREKKTIAWRRVRKEERNRQPIRVSGSARGATSYSMRRGLRRITPTSNTGSHCLREKLPRRKCPDR